MLGVKRLTLDYLILGRVIVSLNRKKIIIWIQQFLLVYLLMKKLNLNVWYHHKCITHYFFYHCNLHAKNHLKCCRIILLGHLIYFFFYTIRQILCILYFNYICTFQDLLWIKIEMFKNALTFYLNLKTGLCEQARTATTYSPCAHGHTHTLLHSWCLLSQPLRYTPKCLKYVIHSYVSLVGLSLLSYT